MPKRKRITISKVEGSEYNFFPPSRFGLNYHYVLNCFVHTVESLFSEKYKLDYFKLSNGGFYMAPIFDGEKQIYDDGIPLTVNSKLIGISVTYNMLLIAIEQSNNKIELEIATKRKDLLKEYIMTLSYIEKKTIRQCIIKW